METQSGKTKKIIVHPGFHKTGTTSLQFFLTANANKLSSIADFYYSEDMKEVSGAARKYGKNPFSWNRTKFRSRFSAFLKTLRDAENIVISNEALCGVMPGYNGILKQMVVSYAPQAKPLIETVTQEIRARFGDEVEITLLFTTRDSDPWLKSAFGHFSRTKGSGLGFERFQKRFGSELNLSSEVKKITSDLTGIRVCDAALEKYSLTKLGPATCILELLEMSQCELDSLTPQPRRNVQGKDLSTFLAVPSEAISASNPEG